jgi:hypothetical protein
MNPCCGLLQAGGLFMHAQISKARSSMTDSQDQKVGDVEQAKTAKEDPEAVEPKRLAKLTRPLPQ